MNIWIFYKHHIQTLTTCQSVHSFKEIYKPVILNLWCTILKWINPLVKEWNESNFKTGLVLHIGDDMKTIRRKPYQKFLNEQLKENNMGDVKILCFSPFEDFNISGVDTRKLAPCMLYNLAKREDLTKAGKKLLKTKWYDNLLTEDFKRLNIKKKIV